ncbi:ATP-binding sensor histidine kinase [Paraburkholderia rhizosphaerae]|uniref:histidine kinase n=1 Tax=Paraburkholderia rhizosphaerae TaxID=480658 RepID=A0A4R8LL89_9BURK|nr:ATP-binding sensor histidine kinase [Paraburkholderia rhizosphaerae]TDY43270.1 PAS domain S-box-containing protein [Paraburkholderia rhizosphaerae]
MTIANCQINDRIGATASADLYRGRLTDGTSVLVKLAADYADPAQSARLKREYQLLQSLDVAGIAKPLALIDERGRSALVLEDFAGESLEIHLDQQPRLDLALCLRIGQHLADALAGIDVARVIHRDIRPANILFEPETGKVLMVDFSMATAEESSAVSAQDATACAGDWAYVSPEQTGRMNRQVDYRTDCYSMGVLLYRMLSGQLPFQANDPLEWTHCHIARVPVPPAGIAPDVPRPVSDIVMKLLAKLPEDRYQSAQGLRADLDQCLAQWLAAGRIDAFALGAEDVPARFQVPHKLYGRDAEAGRLFGAFEQMVATGQAALATVSGYSGIGKSTLVDAVRKPIFAKHGYFIAGKFDQYQRDVPYATLTQAFRELVQQLLAESEARVAGWRQQIQAAVGVNGQLIVDVLPQVELIIGPQPPVTALPPTDAQNRFRMVFRQFVTVFTSEDHPLVLFLDDLQWIDAASLALIEHLLTHPDTRYLLLIGAYRDNEVSAAHPLMTVFATIRDSGAPVIDVRLAPLTDVHLNQLVADTLHASPVTYEPLTRLVCERTQGNPFFFIQFLDALHKEGLLRRDAQQRGWQWDLAQINARDFADNVVDLMVDKLRQLPRAAQQTLQLAACLGNTFDLRHLALVSGHAATQDRHGLSLSESEQGLATAVRASLIVCSNGTGKFLHDRIQQAAYSLIPEADRAEAHLRIGRTLLANLNAEELAEHVFDVANQYNRGAALVIGRDEKAQVAALDLRAGHRAKVSAAYASASVYLAAGIALFDDSDWDTQYRLMFSLRLERAECAYLTGEFAQAEQLIAELLQRGASKIDVAAVYERKVLLHIVKSENPLAVDHGLTCLRLFGIDFPAHPTQQQVEAEYDTVWRNLGEQPIESLIDLPLMTDPELQTTMRLFSTLLEAAYITDVHLFCLLLCRMVNISVHHGTSGNCAHACGFLGFTLGPVFRRYRDGYRFARVGYDLAEKHSFVAYRAMVQHSMGRVCVWTEPVGDAIEFHRAAVRSAIETGTLTFACYSTFQINTTLLLRNDPLDAVWRESQSGLDFVRKARFRDIEDVIVAQQRLIAALQGRTANLATFSDAQFDEAAFEAQLTDDRMTMMICWYWVTKLQARFLAGDYAAALAASKQAEPRLWALFDQVELVEYFYYTALTVAALFESAPSGGQRAWRELLSSHEEQLRAWANTHPPTYAGRHALVLAEIARIEGRDSDAMGLYERAIASGREHGFTLNEGVAHELAAGLCVARGWATAARAHLDEARGCFARLGAHGKVAQLDARMSPLREASVSHATAPGDGAQLDLLSVTKASQAISGQIVLEDLIDTLMHILLETAGAQTGQLLLVRDERADLVAEASVEQKAIHVRQYLNPPAPAASLPQSAARGPDWPGSIVNYVQRSQERVLLDDATQANPFSADDHVVSRQPKSVLCLPLMRRSALIGLLYLENNLATRAFTPERVSVLELLASQAAITLENARLYRDLAEREARIRRLVDANIVGIIIFDLDGRILEANEAFLRMVGHDREDLVSGRMRWTDLTPPEWRDSDVQRTEQLKTTGILQPFEKEYFRKDSSRVPVLIGLAMFEAARSEGVGFVLDLTGRKRAEAQARVSERRYREVQMELAHLNRAATMGQLTASIAHEVQQPISATATYASAALRWLDAKPANVEEVRQALEYIVNEAMRAGGIVSGIRNLVKKAPPRKDQVDINEAVREVIELTQGEAAKHEVSVLTVLGDGLPPVLGDRVQLQQVMLNLIVNAIEAMSARGVGLRELQISTAVDTSNDVTIAVRDSGPGLPPVEVTRLFDPFYTTKQNGLGMGLSICRAIAEAHGGRLCASANAPHGAIFRLVLPRGEIARAPSSEDEGLPVA